MRKIKHFAGYGTVRAGKIEDSGCTLHVRVEGNHEQGLRMNQFDTYGICRWLVMRFDKTVTDAVEWSRKHPLIDIFSHYVLDREGNYVERCEYIFTY